MIRLMRHTIPLLFALLLLGCESGSFDRDKRQIAAKDAIRDLLPPASRQFEIVAFREDTLPGWRNTGFRQPIRYTLEFHYKDSAAVPHQGTGQVLFTPDGNSIIETQLTGQHQ